MTTALPIDTVLPRLVGALDGGGRAVLQAPPGAGKTTRVPLALLHHPGRVVMLEPRRLAARAAAERMSQTLGEPVGATVGYRMRGATKVSDATRIEVVTEGVLTRMLLSDPSLNGIGTLIFDEFHERSLNADFGLALALEVRGALRQDLRLLVMSATLDAAPVAAMLDDAPIITADGRAHPVDTIWLDRPVAKNRRFEDALADLVRTAAEQTDGGILVFLPGASEIRRTAERVSSLSGCVVRPLFGALSAAEQRAAIAPASGPRKVVMATSIAETSLTIEDVRVVVDGGLTRRQKFDPGSGMARLVTERVSRAEADQRRGRAGRVAAGRCYRLWTCGEEGALVGHPPPEIAVADLARLALDLAIWGDRKGAGLAFLTPPPAPAMAGAQALLSDLGMLDGSGAPTDHGRVAAAMPVHPRLAHMLAIAGAQAAPLAALLSAPPQPGAPVDLAERLARPLDPPARAEARRLSRSLPRSAPASVGEMVALAYPDRVAQRRPGDAPRYLTAGGKGAALSAEVPLATQTYLAIAETDGHPREARVRSAAAISESEIRATFGDRIEQSETCVWSPRDAKVLAARQERLGALVLNERPWTDAPAETVAAAMLDGVRDHGLAWTESARRLARRVAWAREAGEDLPDMSSDALLADLEWLLPHIGATRTGAAWRAFDIHPALRAMLDWRQRQALDRAAPARFTTPLGRDVPITYSDEAPEVAVRLQELFGVTRHPAVAGRPIRLTLLSPAGRPVQVTSDLPGFWANSYADVRRDMRGRYPKHPWPENPTVAKPTLRAKPRG